MESDPVRLRHPFTVECDSVLDAATLQAANAQIATRHGCRVTFRRTVWMRNCGTRPKPANPEKPIVVRPDYDFR